MFYSFLRGRLLGAQIMNKMEAATDGRRQNGEAFRA
jgi:hypothetical protein